MKNSLNDLRNHLFVALENLADPDAKIDIERIKQITEVSKVLVDTAKVEVAFINAVGDERLSTGFIESKPALPAPGGQS